jgi:hypothetical protein
MVVVLTVTSLSNSERADSLRERQEINTYLHRFADAVDEFSERTAPLNYEFDPRKAERSRLFGDLIEVLSGLTPPDSVAEPHITFVSAIEDFREIDQELQRKAQDVEYGPEMVELISTTYAQGRAIANRFANACNELQQVADESGIAVNLECAPSDEEDQAVFNGCLDLSELPEGGGSIRAHASCDDDIAPIDDLCSSELGPHLPFTRSGAPDPPPGMVQASELFRLDGERSPAGTVCIPLYGDYEEDDLLGFYAYKEGGWRHIGRLQLRQGGEIAEGEFENFPDNFAAFKPLKDAD